MKTQITLTEKEMKDAIMQWAKDQGYEPASVSLSHYKGDRPGDSETTTATVQTESKPVERLQQH